MASKESRQESGLSNKEVYYIRHTLEPKHGNQEYMYATSPPPIRFNGTRFDNISASVYQPRDHLKQSDISEDDECNKRKVILSSVAIIVVVMVILGLATGITIAILDDNRSDAAVKTPVANNTVIEAWQKYYVGSAVIANMDWDPQLDNAGMVLYRQTGHKFVAHMDEIYRHNIDTQSTYNQTHVTGFQQGSVVVLFVLEFTIKVEVPVVASDHETAGRELSPVALNTIIAVLQGSNFVVPDSVFIFDAPDTMTLPTTMTTTTTITSANSTATTSPVSASVSSAATTTITTPTKAVTSSSSTPTKSTLTATSTTKSSSAPTTETTTLTTSSSTQKTASSKTTTTTITTQAPETVTMTTTSTTQKTASSMTTIIPPPPTTTTGSVTISTSSPTSTSLSSTSGTCQLDEFWCPETGDCIPQSYLCDGEVDCILSGADEDADLCSLSTTVQSTSPTVTGETTSVGTVCATDEFQCVSDGSCIYDYWQCDDYQDCEDNSDEEGCNQVVECMEGQFTCIKQAECIDASLLCDGNYDCTDKTDEWCGVTPSPWQPVALEVRLMQGDVDTTASLFGRVEVRLLGTDEYGTVCHDGWSSEEAMVVCRMLNSWFTGTAYAYRSALFGEGSGSVVMSNTGCHGDESNLGSCKSHGFGYGLVHCSHRQDAGVSCGKEVSTTPETVVQKSEVRLMDGSTCLEGNVQILHEGEWSYICDDSFDDKDATVVCRMLGYNAGEGHMFSEFGNGDGSFWLDEVECQGHEMHLADCPANTWGDHDCGKEEVVGIVCDGSVEIDCSASTECLPSINCTFDEGNCCYRFPSSFAAGQGSSVWVRNTADQILTLYHSQNTSHGGIVYYRNVYGHDGDGASLLLPKYDRSSQPQKLEFYYLIQSSGRAALTLELLTLDGDKAALWEMDIFLPEMEGQWIYNCVEIAAEKEGDLQFVAQRGPDADRVIALDDVTLSTGTCIRNIADAICSFDSVHGCGMTVTCSKCQQKSAEYRWWWKNVTIATIDGETSLPQEMIFDHYMLADASYGLAGDVAKMQFHMDSVSNRNSLKFRYVVFGQSTSMLKVSVEKDGSSTKVWETRAGTVTGEWVDVCVKVTSVYGPVGDIVFETVRGESLFGDVAVDDVELVDSCQYSVSCDFETGNCGYQVVSMDTEHYTWGQSNDEVTVTVETRLVGGTVPYEGRVEVYHDGEWGTVCDDGWDTAAASVVCHQLGYGYSNVEAFHESHFGEGEGQIWMDEVSCVGTEQKISTCVFDGWANEDCDHTEDAGVRCDATIVEKSGQFYQVFDNEAPYGVWTRLFSPPLDTLGEEHMLTFRVLKLGTGFLKIYITSDNGKEERQKLSVTMDTDGFEDMCINLPAQNLAGARLVFEVVKGSMWNKGGYLGADIVYVDDIDLKSGTCADTLDVQPCTFEQDFRLCSFTVTSGSEVTCEAEYKWKRQGGHLGNVMQKEENDHTLGDGTGHYMAINAVSMNQSSQSTITFKPVHVENGNTGMHVNLYYKISNSQRTSSALSINVNGQSGSLSQRLSLLNVWEPACVDIGALSGAFVAVSVTAYNVDAAIDDVALLDGPCQSSVSCLFANSYICGYVSEEGWTHTTNGTETFMQVSTTSSRLVSPRLQASDTNSCLTITLKTNTPIDINTGFKLIIEVINAETGKIIQEAKLNLVLQTDWKEIHLEIPRLLGDHVIAVSVDGQMLSESSVIEVQSIELTGGKCLPIDCLENEHRCGVNVCIPESLVCDYYKHCPDGSDEDNCVVTANCTFDNVRMCGYKSYNTYWSEEANENGEIDLYPVLAIESELAFIETSSFFIANSGCLTFTLLRQKNFNSLRVIRNTSAVLVVLEDFSDVIMQDRMIDLKLNLSSGEYSVIFESQHLTWDTMTTDGLVIDNVVVYDNACPSRCSVIEYTCTYDRLVSMARTLCLPADVICNKKLDCPSGGDELNCGYSFECDFEVDSNPWCGYDLSGIQRVTTPYLQGSTLITTETQNGEGHILLFNATNQEEGQVTTGLLNVSSAQCTVYLHMAYFISPDVAEHEAFLHIRLVLTGSDNRWYDLDMWLDWYETPDWYSYEFLVSSFTSSQYGNIGQDVFGPYSLTLEIYSNGLVLAIDSISVDKCGVLSTSTSGPSTSSPIPPGPSTPGVLTSSVSQTNSSSTSTSGPVLSTDSTPEDFPEVSVGGDDVLGGLFEDLTLTCVVEKTDNYQVDLFWYRDSTQLTRNNDIIHQSELETKSGNLLLKYEVVFMIETLKIVYNLTVNRLVTEDSGVYRCIVDVFGFNESQRPLDTIQLLVQSSPMFLTEDNCYKNTVPHCHIFGYGKVTTPGPFGIINIMDTRQMLLSTVSNSMYDTMSSSCSNALQDLDCGLFTPKCKAGEPVPLCRDHCEEIVSLCLTAPSTESKRDYYLYGCAFLPYMDEEPNCVRVWSGCGNTYKAATGTLRSQNYPDSFPNQSNCSYSLHVERFHSVEIEIVDFDIKAGAGREVCYFEIQDTVQGSVIMHVPCGDAPDVTTIRTQGNTAVIRLVTDEVSSGRGFYVKYKQFLSNGCRSRSGENDLVLSSPRFPETHLSSETESCLSTLVYLNNSKDTLYVKVSHVSDGCVRISHIVNETHVRHTETVCAITDPMYRSVQGQVLLDFDETTVYEMEIHKQSYVRSIDSVTLDGAGLVEVQSEGEIGFMCGYLYQPAADVICRSLGHGWPGEVTEFIPTSTTIPKLLSGIQCTGQETHVSQCGAVFDAQGSNSCSSKYFHKLQCKPVSLSCDFMSSTCGYTLSEQILHSQDVGIYIATAVYATGTARSPGFQYTPGVTIKFDYSIRRSAGDHISIVLFNMVSNTSQALWQSQQRAVYGTFSGCLPLPSQPARSDKYQLVVEYTTGLAEWPDISAPYTALRGVSVSLEPCTENTCTFENPDTCDVFINMDSATCPVQQDNDGRVLLTNSDVFARDRDWIVQDHTYANATGHHLLIDEGSRVVLINKENVALEDAYVSLFYSIYSPPADERTIIFKLQTLSDVYKVEGRSSGWKQACIHLSGSPSDAVNLSFGDQYFYDTGISKKKMATLAVDDISLSQEPCSDSVTCDFESHCYQSYHDNLGIEAKFPWKRVKAVLNDLDSPNTDASFSTPGKGFYMHAELQKGVEGDKAILQTELLEESSNFKCAVFSFYISGNSTPGKLGVNLIMAKALDNKYIHIASGDHGDEWFRTNVPLPAGTRYIEFIATKGVGAGTIAIDDFELSTSDCGSGIQDLGMCTFDDPFLCNYESDSSPGSQYQWIRYNPAYTEEYQYDADGSYQGHFMRIAGSKNVVGHKASLWFKVTTNRREYQFWYRVTKHTTSQLFTYYNDRFQSRLSTAVTDVWVMSPCFNLPTNFDGNIYIVAEHGADTTHDFDVDNVQLLEQSQCRVASLACDFTSDVTCGYISVDAAWVRDSGDGWRTVQDGVLQAPVINYPASSVNCFGFTYAVTDAESVTQTSILSVWYGDDETWYSYGLLGQDGLVTRHGQITLQGGVVNIKFVSSGRGLFRLQETSLTAGACPPVKVCDKDEFSCQEKCIPQDQVCDRTIHCNHGNDENEARCGFTLKTDFTTASSLSKTGYQTGAASFTTWELKTDTRLTIKGNDSLLEGQVLISQFNSLTTEAAILESPEYHLMEPACLVIEYLGDAAYAKVSLVYQDANDSNVVTFYVVSSPSIRHFSIPLVAGNVRVILSVYMVRVTPGYQGYVPDTAVFGISLIDIYPGQMCNNIAVVCPSDIPNLCMDRRMCYTDGQKCDLHNDCTDQTDETQDCGLGIVCDFESRNLCGYHNVSVSKKYRDERGQFTYTQTLWERVPAHVISRPSVDQTYKQSGKGHFMTSKNHEGLLDSERHLDVETMQSPYETFNQSGCISFWYYLNSTEHQPETTSAQIFVYLQYEDATSRLLLWFDHINRPIHTWVQGGVPVQAGRSVSLYVTAKTSIPYNGYAGVVSLDDVEYHSGECTVLHPDCDTDMFRCVKDDVCVPVSFVCDGEPDCGDSSDESSCDRPDGALQLTSGDGSYGKLSYFYHNSWRPVCFPASLTGQSHFNIHTADTVCRKLGFSGNSAAFGYRLWEKKSEYDIVLTCDEDEECTIDPTTQSCDMYAYIKCSNDACFSGERLCPGTTSTCKPRSHFCDGMMDCPENGDEKQCYCFYREQKCLHIEEECKDKFCETCEDRGMFECKDHQCLPKIQRCDGVSQCLDGTDEYRCVQVDKDLEVTVFDRSYLERRPVCVDDVTLDAAQHFCRLSGQGYATEILRGTSKVNNGVKVIQSDWSRVVPGYDFTNYGECFPLQLECNMPECGTTSIQDDVVQPYVINGKAAYIDEWPWYGLFIEDGFIVCGVSLIHPLWAMTASHCLRPNSEYSVAFGVDKLGGSGEWTQVVPVQKIIDYGLIKDGYLLQDMTLLKLSREVNVNNYTRPVCLPTIESFNTIMSLGKEAECYIVGFGADETIFSDPSATDVYPGRLMKKRLQIVSYEYCRQKWVEEENNENFPQNVVCAGIEGPNSPSCLGDSGGPVTCKTSRGRWEQLGVVSFGYVNCDHDLIPTVYTSVAHYRDWIESTTGLDFSMNDPED